MCNSTYSKIVICKIASASKKNMKHEVHFFCCYWYRPVWKRLNRSKFSLHPNNGKWLLSLGLMYFVIVCQETILHLDLNYKWNPNTVESQQCIYWLRVKISSSVFFWKWKVQTSQSATLWIRLPRWSSKCEFLCYFFYPGSVFWYTTMFFLPHQIRKVRLSQWNQIIWNQDAFLLQILFWNIMTDLAVFSGCRGASAKGIQERVKQIFLLVQSRGGGVWSGKWDY